MIRTPRVSSTEGKPSSPSFRPTCARARRVRSIAVRMVIFTIFLLVLGRASAAFAAAPMCDHQAQSIAAPATMKPLPERKLSAAAPCEAELVPHFEVNRRTPAQPLELTLDLGQRIAPSLLAIPLSLRAAVLPTPEAAFDPPAIEFHSDVFRPPRSR